MLGRALRTENKKRRIRGRKLTRVPRGVSSAPEAAGRVRRRMGVARNPPDPNEAVNTVEKIKET
jgi:hypothetical protein